MENSRVGEGYSTNRGNKKRGKSITSARTSKNGLPSMSLQPLITYLRLVSKIHIKVDRISIRSKLFSGDLKTIYRLSNSE